MYSGKMIEMIADDELYTEEELNQLDDCELSKLALEILFYTRDTLCLDDEEIKSVLKLIKLMIIDFKEDKEQQNRKLLIQCLLGNGFNSSKVPKYRAKIMINMTKIALYLKRKQMKL